MEISTNLSFNEIKNAIQPLNQEAMEQASQRQHALIKPIGSLGVLENIGIKFAGITGKVKNQINKKILFLFGADNGVYEEGIANSPQNFTNLLMSCYGAEKGSGINVICKHNNVDLKIIDVGVIGELDYSVIDNQRLMEGTNNFAKEKAIPEETVIKAIEIGISYAKFAAENGYDIIGTGEVGIGNTTTAAACIMAALGIDNPDLAVGKGAGLSEEAFENKKQVVKKALELHKPDSKNPVEILCAVGGLDIAALVGVYLGAAYLRIPVVVDGIISISAAILANIINSEVKNYTFPSHISEEPGYKLAADYLGFSAFLNLNMRLGEGTGCPMSMGIIENALAIMNNMDTFEDLAMDSNFRIEI